MELQPGKIDQLTINNDAVRSKQLIDLKKQHGWHGIIAATRKTTPGNIYIYIYMSIFRRIHFLKDLELLKNMLV